MKDELHQTLTVLLDEIGAGASDGWEKLLPVIYDHLKSLASRITGPKGEAATLSPTALVNEAWAKIAGQDGIEFTDRQHFFAVAALTMRQILVDQARRKRAQKRGGDQGRVTLSGLPGRGMNLDLLDLDDALTQLEKLSPRQARVVNLRFFGGLTVTEVSGCLGNSVATVEADWRTARAWLGTMLKPRED
ncbi:MAG: RNA polymerase sigma-70 factor (ECF subfamily) [Planctomycetota bacterium]|jgi:RNA polymerase sigma-70 factor (ECF subfamily)